MCLSLRSLHSGCWLSSWPAQLCRCFGFKPCGVDVCGSLSTWESWFVHSTCVTRGYLRVAFQGAVHYSNLSCVFVVILKYPEQDQWMWLDLRCNNKPEGNEACYWNATNSSWPCYSVDVISWLWGIPWPWMLSWSQMAHDKYYRAFKVCLTRESSDQFQIWQHERFTCTQLPSNVSQKTIPIQDQTRVEMDGVILVRHRESKLVMHSWVMTEACSHKPWGQALFAPVQFPPPEFSQSNKAKELCRINLGRNRPKQVQNGHQMTKRSKFARTNSFETNREVSQKGQLTAKTSIHWYAHASGWLEYLSSIMPTTYTGVWRVICHINVNTLIL